MVYSVLCVSFFIFAFLVESEAPLPAPAAPVHRGTNEMLGCDAASVRALREGPGYGCVDVDVDVVRCVETALSSVQNKQRACSMYCCPFFS